MKTHGDKLKQKYGEDFYSRLGRKGGAVKVPKGFATMDVEKQKEASSKGGKNGKPYSKINK